MSAISRISSTCLRLTAALGLSAALAIAFTPRTSAAGPVTNLAGKAVTWQLDGGWFTDNGDFFLGAGAQLGVARLGHVVPNVEWVMLDGGNAYTINLDVLRNVLPTKRVTGYLGIGVGMFIVDPDQGDSDSHGALNLIVGAATTASRFNPFAQFKWIATDGDDPQVFAVGVRF